MKHLFIKMFDNHMSVASSAPVAGWCCSNCGKYEETAAFSKDPPVLESPCQYDYKSLNINLVRRLNRLCEDPATREIIGMLIELRTPVSSEYDHPSVITTEKGVNGSGIFEVGLLGILNGIRDHHHDPHAVNVPETRIAAQYSDDEGKPECFTGFILMPWPPREETS